MEQITIDVTDSKIIVHDGRLARARLKYYAPNIEIYVRGVVPIKMRDKVNYHAIENCIARHIPLKSLVSYGWV